MTEESAADKERERGKVFTDTQREYLNRQSNTGERRGDFSENYASTLETRIQQRVVGLLEDLQLLTKLDKKQRKYIFESNKKHDRKGRTVNMDGEVRNIPDRELFLSEGQIGMAFAFDSFLEFYHRTMRENGCSLEGQRKQLQYFFSEAERLARLETDGGRYNVDTTIEVDIERVDTEDRLEDAKQRFQEDGIHGVTKAELQALDEAGHITLHGDWE